VGLTTIKRWFKNESRPSSTCIDLSKSSGGPRLARTDLLSYSKGQAQTYIKPIVSARFYEGNAHFQVNRASNIERRSLTSSLQGGRHPKAYRGTEAKAAKFAN
jgi:hypothetical protein